MCEACLGSSLFIQCTERNLHMFALQLHVSNRMKGGFKQGNFEVRRAERNHYELRLREWVEGGWRGVEGVLDTLVCGIEGSKCW